MVLRVDRAIGRRLHHSLGLGGLGLCLVQLEPIGLLEQLEGLHLDLDLYGVRVLVSLSVIEGSQPGWLGGKL